MNKAIKFLSLIFVLALVSCTPKAEQYEHIEITTELGVMKVKLFNSTPGHRDNIIKLAKENFYNDLLFHRVMGGFMAQGGDPDSRGAAPDRQLGGGGPGYTIPHEIGAPHLKGALAAARTSNPEKRSSGSQFYLVQGKKMTDRELEGFQKQKGITYSPEQIKLYKEIGGAPFLDMEYTVYGEVVEGIEVIDKICAAPTKPGDRPINDIKMQVKYLGKE